MGFGQESFFVDDLPRHRPDRRISQSCLGCSSGSDRSASPQDRRAKIARRMMPAAMLKRLEFEAAEKERRKAHRKRKENRRVSPIGPGRAVARRGQGDVDLQDLVGVIGSDDEVSDGMQMGSPSPKLPADRQEQLIVISDDESSGSSQALKDNAGEQSLTRLYDGDFESLVGGKRANHRAQRTLSDYPRGQVKRRRKHFRRSVLGLVKRTRMPLSDGNRALVQSLLEFPSEKDSLARRDQIEKPKRKSRSRKQRPAIRLDDHVIFATADFAFDTQDLLIAPQPRTFKRSDSKTISQPDTLDTGIGKARSWANLDKIPVAFDISPLPSGLYCDSVSFVGNGGLARLVSLLRGDDSAELYHREGQSMYTAHGIDLKFDMSPLALSAVLPVLFDGLFNDATGLANGSDADQQKLALLDFFSQYLTARKHTDGSDDLQSAFRAMIAQLANKLDELTVSKIRHSRPLQEFLLRIRWSLLDFSMRLSLYERTENDRLALVETCGTAVVCQLFAMGFDKTVRPLKSILRAEVDSPEIVDLSITVWIALLHSFAAWDQRQDVKVDTFGGCLDKALDSSFRLDQTGPIAAERVWFLVFGLCAVSQFDVNGHIAAKFVPAPRWPLIRRAISFIKISHNEETEEKAHLDQLRGRDRYIKTMIARCVRLSSVWRWNLDRGSFSIATKDLGAIFKVRQHRNLPTESPADYPDWITSFDISLSATEDTKHETAFELYLRLVCVAASDIIASAQSLSEAQQAEKDVQCLIMSIIPVSPVRFNRVLPPTARQLGQLVNRYSTMVAACYFSPSLLVWLLANSKKWAPFEQADFESRQISIRGLMYLAVACRHHQHPLGSVVSRLAEILSCLQRELDESDKPSARAQAPTRLEITRTMVLVVSCFRRIIVHHSFDLEERKKPVYPDPCLLHESEFSVLLGPHR